MVNSLSSDVTTALCSVFTNFDVEIHEVNSWCHVCYVFLYICILLWYFWLLVKQILVCLCCFSYIYFLSFVMLCCYMMFYLYHYVAMLISYIMLYQN